jgi:hypothetical protein
VCDFPGRKHLFARLNSKFMRISGHYESISNFMGTLGKRIDFVTIIRGKSVERDILRRFSSQANKSIFIALSALEVFQLLFAA